MMDRTFTRLRLRLTALYFAATIGFLALISVIAYSLISVYFESTTDLALRYRMAREYLARSLPIPSDLQTVGNEWGRLRGRAPVVDDPLASHSDDEHRESGDGSAANPPSYAPAPEDAYDGDLAALVVVLLDAQGQRIVADIGAAAHLFEPDAAAAQAARANGADLRTIRSAGGAAIRLYTRRLPSNASADVIQIGRVLTDQEAVLKQLLTGLLIAGGAIALLATASSWWLAGRSLRPAQQAWQRQRDFVANASHELRTPLSLIQLSAEASARADTTDDERRELSSDILRETKYMTQLVGDLLLLSRLDAGQLKLDMQPVALPALLAEVMRDVARLADEQGVALDAVSHGEVAHADRMRLRQTLLILLDNALRHTPRGGRVVLESMAQGRSVRIAVSDNGSGIAPDHLERVFDRFYQADAAHTTQGSAGLGLSIAKSLAEAMRGHIAIASETGQGTRVTITLRNDADLASLKDV